VKQFGMVRRLLEKLGERGGAAIEFAIVGSSFMVMFLAAFEFGYMLFIQSVLDNATYDAARLIRTGQVQATSNPQTTFQNLLCNDVGSLISCGSLIYQAQVYANWGAAQTAVNTPPSRNTQTGAYNTLGFSSGAASEILVVTVTYNYPYFTPWIGSLAGAGGFSTAFLMSTVVFQNEPF